MDTFHYQIRAVNVKANNGAFTKTWEINDKISKEYAEKSIWFWTKYTDFKDYDSDGLVDPIIIY